MKTTPEGSRTAKILIVEDEESVRDALVKILESSGYRVIAVCDCPEALDRFDNLGGFDVVLTDLSLPGPSGWEVAAAIKKRSPKTPVILLSGWDVTDEKPEVKGSVNRILTKPVKIKDMLQAIKDLAQV